MTPISSINPTTPSGDSNGSGDNAPSAAVSSILGEDQTVESLNPAPIPGVDLLRNARREWEQIETQGEEKVPFWSFLMTKVREHAEAWALPEVDIVALSVVASVHKVRADNQPPDQDYDMTIRDEETLRALLRETGDWPRLRLSSLKGVEAIISDTGSEAGQSSEPAPTRDKHALLRVIYNILGDRKYNQLRKRLEPWEGTNSIEGALGDIVESIDNEGVEGDVQKQRARMLSLAAELNLYAARMLGACKSTIALKLDPTVITRFLSESNVDLSRPMPAIQKAWNRFKTAHEFRESAMRMVLSPELFEDPEFVDLVMRGIVYTRSKILGSDEGKDANLQTFRKYTKRILEGLVYEDYEAVMENIRSLALKVPNMSRTLAAVILEKPVSQVAKADFDAWLEKEREREKLDNEARLEAQAREAMQRIQRELAENRATMFEVVQAKTGKYLRKPVLVVSRDKETGTYTPELYWVDDKIETKTMERTVEVVVEDGKIVKKRGNSQFACVCLYPHSGDENKRRTGFRRPNLIRFLEMMKDTQQLLAELDEGSMMQLRRIVDVDPKTGIVTVQEDQNYGIEDVERINTKLQRFWNEQLFTSR